MAKKWIRFSVGAAIGVIGMILVLVCRNAAIAQEASLTQKIPFVVGLIVALGGILVAITALLPRRQPVNIHTLTLAAMLAALCYIGFAFFQIKIPVGDSSTSFHLGNVFCVLAALLIGPLWGGLAGAVGMLLFFLLLRKGSRTLHPR